MKTGVKATLLYIIGGYPFRREGREVGASKEYGLTLRSCAAQFANHVWL